MKTEVEDASAVTDQQKKALEIQRATQHFTNLITQAKKIKRAQAKYINNRINKLLKQGNDADGKQQTDETNKILFNAQQAANQQDANAGGTTATGIPITDQPFYQTDSGEIDFDALMPPSASDDDDDDDDWYVK